LTLLSFAENDRSHRRFTITHGAVAEPPCHAQEKILSGVQHKAIKKSALIQVFVKKMIAPTITILATNQTRQKLATRRTD
jgi:hypothetical protein